MKNQNILYEVNNEDRSKEKFLSCEYLYFVPGNQIRKMLSRHVSSKASPKLWNAYSTQALPKKSGLPEQPKTVTKLPNGVLVMSLENYAPISSVSFTFKSGLKYENVRNAGVSQKMKMCAGLKTKKFSAFINARQIPQMGGNFNCKVERETMSYDITGPIRGDIDLAYSHVENIASRPLFRRWELGDTVKDVPVQNIIRCPVQHALDLMHSGAFHGRGLGNSLLIPDYNLGEITDTELRDFWNNTHSLQRLSVIGIGVDHETLAIAASEIDTEASGNMDVITKYTGGENRKETDGPIAYVAMGGPGASIPSITECDALTIAKYALQCDKGLPYGTNVSSKLTEVVRKAGGSGTTRCFNINYSDCGLFGFILAEPVGNAGNVTKALAKFMRNYKITDAELAAAKVKAKSAFLHSLENRGNLIDFISQSILFNEKYRDPTDLCAGLDAVTASDVNNALSNVMKGKPCMGAYGGISNVPFLDEF